MVKGEGLPILTLTIWKSLQSLYHFTYLGDHKNALLNRNKWIEQHPDKQPTYVLVWAVNHRLITKKREKSVSSFFSFIKLPISAARL